MYLFVGTNNFIEYLQSYQILIFIYNKFYFIIFIIIQYTVYAVGTLAAIQNKNKVLIVSFHKKKVIFVYSYCAW